MKSIISRHCFTQFLFCSLFLLATPALAETPTHETPTHETAKTDATKLVSNQSEVRKRYNERSLYALHLNLPPLALSNDYLSDSWFNPHHGQDGPSLNSREFYQALGDQELLDQYNSNRFKKSAANVMIIGGGIGAVASIPWLMIVATGDALGSSALGAGESRENKPNYALPLSVLAISAASLITGAIIAPNNVHPLKVDDATKILDQYNNDLKQNLGLPQDYSPLSTAP